MIPIMVGGPGKKTMRPAARYADIWNTFGSNIEDYTARVNILKQHCADLGRDISTLRLTWAGVMAIGQTEAEAQRHAEEIGAGGPFIETPTQIAEKMAAFIELGVDYFIIRIAGLPDPDIVGLVTEDLMPRIKAL